MKILILSENYLNGGMETHIETYIKNMKEDEFYIVTTNTSNSIWEKNIFKSIKNVNFNDGQVKDILLEIQRYIYKNKIELVHAHTYKTYVIAGILGYRLNIPYVYTIHGPSTINGAKKYIGIKLFNYCLNSLNGLIVVSKETEQLVKLVGDFKGEILNNPIDMNLFKETTTEYIKEKWAIVSRLDFDKTFGIKQGLLAINNTEIQQIDIFGDGNGKEDLISWIEENRLKLKIVFKGESLNVAEDLERGQYEGVFAMGRAALEGLAKNIPVILIGYKGINCSVTKGNFDSILLSNFSGRNMKIASLEEIREFIDGIKAERQKYRLRDIVYEKCNIEVLAKRYKGILERPLVANKLNNINEALLDVDTLCINDISELNKKIK